MQVTGAVSPAFDRAKRVLFQPFDIAKWFAYGLVFFVASLIDPIGGYTGRLQIPSFDHGTAPTTPPVVPEFPPELAAHGPAILGGLALASVIGIAIGIAIAWVGARGLMMAYRSASMGYVALGESWRETASPGNALFRLYLLLSAIGFVFALPILVLAGASAVGLWQSGERDMLVLAHSIIPYLVVLGVLGFAGGLVAFVVRQFIAPFLLFFPREGVRGAWSRFFALLKADVGGVVAFLVARVALAAVMGIASSIVATCTCCIGGLPVLHQTVLAPLLFFDRAFTLHALASIGPEYAEMAPALPPVATPWQR